MVFQVQKSIIFITLILLAERGFRVVLPEAAYHGERHSGLTQGTASHAFLGYCSAVN